MEKESNTTRKLTPEEFQKIVDYCTILVNIDRINKKKEKDKNDSQ